MIRIRRGEWTIECDAASEAVDVLDRIGQAIASPAAPVAAAVTAKRRRLEKDPESGLPKDAAPKEECEFPDCTTKLRKNSGRCEPCGRRLCRKHINKKTGVCPDCGARPE